MQEYEDCKRRFAALKQKTLNRVIRFGRHKGKTIQDIFTLDRQYLYWLLRKTNIDIDPELLGLEMPTRQKILSLLKLEYKEGTFIYEIIHPALYDTWNVGHYGCREPECIKEATREHYEYSFDDILSPGHKYIDRLRIAYPYIKWTKNYLKSLFNAN